ncbi:MAG: tryptophan synthase subunit alpha [Bacteroidales bacterium]|nr:tryptophan synthase subunit alpha [Bacteroidales bacterium]
MNKIDELFAAQRSTGRKLLSLYFCAGSPTLDGTAGVIRTLDSRGIDMVEVGIPFSDPLADGPVIQQAATKAIANGMTLTRLFGQLESLRGEVKMPLVMMGYLNVILHYGIENFCRRCAECGVSGMIVPDLPFADYLEEVKPIADKYGLRVIMLITPETSDERIRFIDANTDGFIYMVSSAGITGGRSQFSDANLAYFRRIDALHLRNPRMIGFGISNRQTLLAAQTYAAGAIVGSKFVSLLDEAGGDASLALDRLYAALEK